MSAALDIVIPVYNEGGNIAAVLESLREKVRTPFRVLICYDRDDDDTLPAARAHQTAHPMELEFVKNRARGAHGAVVSGFKAGRAPAAVMLPADDTFNASVIDSMYRQFQEGCEIVSGSRFMPGGCMKGCPWLKFALVRSSAFVLYHLAGLPTADPSNGMRLFSRRVLDRIPVESSVGFSYSIELLVKAHRLGWKVGNVPTLWFERKIGTSRFQVLRWLPEYLRWFRYAFATTYLRRGPETVRLNPE